MRCHLPYGITQYYLPPDRLTQVKSPERLLLELPTPEGWKAELASVIGYISRWFTSRLTVTHPSSNRARCRATALIETNVLTLLVLSPTTVDALV